MSNLLKTLLLLFGLSLTFCAPQKWSIKKKEGEPYADTFGETRNGLTSNINVQTASVVISLSKYTDFGVEAVLKSKEKFAVSKLDVKSRSEFIADVPGIKVVYDIDSNGIKLKSIQYFFKGVGDTKIVITATLPLSDTDASEELIDASLKTLKITSKSFVIRAK